MKPPRAPAPISVRLERPTMRFAEAFLRAAKASRPFHRHFAHPPSTVERYRDYVKRMRKPTHIGHLVCTDAGELAGVININEVVRGVFCSGYLGYYALAPNQGHGYMRAGLVQVVQLAFGEYGLHRLEANIQPDNPRSLALVKSLEFRREGYSPRYVKLAGRWRDHERWAITVEEWKPRGRR